MRAKFIALVVTLLAMAIPATAMAGGVPASPGGGAGGIGQAQQSSQWAATLQAAQSQAQAGQTAVNTNAPVNTAGGNITGGSNSANQTAGNGAISGAGNNADTKQTNDQSQAPPLVAPPVPAALGQAQDSSQWSATLQKAQSDAKANQNAVNANVPVNIAGGNVTGRQQRQPDRCSTAPRAEPATTPTPSRATTRASRQVRPARSVVAAPARPRVRPVVGARCRRRSQRRRPTRTRSTPTFR